MSYQQEAAKLYRLRKDTEDQERVLVNALDAAMKRNYGSASGLANRLGVSAQFISDYRRGRKRIGTALLRELSEA